MQTLTQKYLRLDDEIIEAQNVMRRLADTVKRLKGQQDEIKLEILREYETQGVLPDDGLIVKRVPPKLIVTDESKLPDKFFKIERKLDKRALNDDFAKGNYYEGCTMDNGGLTIAIKGR
jgi:hypothetical protein